MRRLGGGRLIILIGGAQIVRDEGITLPLKAEHDHPARRALALIHMVAVSAHRCAARRPPGRVFSSPPSRLLYELWRLRVIHSGIGSEHVTSNQSWAHTKHGDEHG